MMVQNKNNMATYTGLVLWLKDKNTSITQKLKLSKFAWGTDAVHIPNKEQQLLDFICGLLVNKKKHNLQASDLLPTWKTLLMFLQASGQAAVVKPSILQAAVEDIGKNAKGKESIKESHVNLDLQNTVISCACCLLALPSVASAQFELLCSVLGLACSLKSCGDSELSESADRLLLSVLPVLVKCQRAHLHQPQVLHAVLDKVLACSLRVMDKCPNHIAQMLQDFLLACLLHSDHQEAYEVYLRHSCGEPAPGQPKQPPKVMTSLFTALATLISDEDTKDPAKKFIPNLLQSFLKENKRDPRICFLMLKRLIKLMTPVIYGDTKVVDESPTESSTDSGWLEGVSACIGVCQNEASLDLFSASRQSGDILTWFSKLTQLVMSQDRCASWFDFMRHMLGLNHLVVEKLWHVILQHSLTSPQQKPEGLEVAQDQFLCEIVSVYVRMRRTSDLLSALLEACLTSSEKVRNLQESTVFHTRLCKMFREVPLTTLLEMWDKLHSKASFLVDQALSHPTSNDGKTDLHSQLEWTVALYTVLLGNARLFDHRSGGAFSNRISSLVTSVGEQVLSPLFKTKEMRKLCPGAGNLLKTWSYLQVMLLPRWRESDGDNETPSDFNKLKKWIKRLEAPDKVKISLQRLAVASPESCPIMAAEESGEGTLEQVVGSLLEMQPLQYQDVTRVIENQSTINISKASVVAQYSSLCQLLPLIGTQLSLQLLSRCADLTLSILGHGQGDGWTNSCPSAEALPEEKVTLLSLARNLILHPATRELKFFQQRMVTQAWAEIIKNMSFTTQSPAKKKKKADLETKSEAQKITNILTDDELNLQDIGEISLAGLDVDISEPLRCKEMIKVLSCLDLEYLPDVNLRCQVGAITLLSCWTKPGQRSRDQLKEDGERLFVRSMSVPNTSRLFKIIHANELLQLVTDYCTKNADSLKPLLEVAVQAVMMEHGSVLHMPGFVKQILANIDQETASSGCVKFQLLSLLVKHCHKYLKKAFHIKEVGQAATDAYFSVARHVIKHGLDWYKNLAQQSKTQEVTTTTGKGSIMSPQQKESRKKKRKREKSGDIEEEQDLSSMLDTVEPGVDVEGLVSQAWNAVLNCVTEVLDLWDVQVAEAKVNEHLELMVRQIVDIVLTRWKDKAERAELLFIQSCCYCQLRSCKASGGQEVMNEEAEEAETEHDLQDGLCLLNLDAYPKLWTACFGEAEEAVKRCIQNGERLESARSDIDWRAESSGIEERQALYQNPAGVGSTTDVLCALLASADTNMFSILLDILQAYLVSSCDLDPSTVVVATDVWRKLLTSEVLGEESSQILFKNMYQFLSSLLSTVQNLAQCDSSLGGSSQIQNSALFQASEKQVASRCVVRALAEFAELGKTNVTPRMTLLCLHAGFSLELSQPADVEVVCRLLNTLLVRHTNTMHTTVPAVLDLVNKLLRASMNLGGQDRLSSDSGLVPQVLHCAQLVTRLLTLLSSPAYKAELQKVAHTVVAEYVTGIQRQSLHTIVKAELLRGLYKLMTVSDKFRLAALNAALPAGVKDTFKVMHQEYNKYHRYSGTV